MNRRGSVRDVLFVTIALFVTGFAVFVMHYTFNTVVDDMTDPNMNVINDSNATQEALKSAQAVTERFDYAVFAVFIGMVLALMITGWLIGGHPHIVVILFR